MAVTINGSAGVTTNSGAVYDSIQRGTSVTASGTSVDFTSIPSWVRRITVMLSGVSTSGTSVVQIQLGSSTYTTSGYVSIGTGITAGTVSSVTNNATGFGIGNEGGTAASTRVGAFTFTNISGNIWTATFQYALSDATRALFGSGNVTLGGVLDRVRITTVNGTDTFDAGTINILFE